MARRPRKLTQATALRWRTYTQLEVRWHYICKRDVFLISTQAKRTLEETLDRVRRSPAGPYVRKPLHVCDLKHGRRVEGSQVVAVCMRYRAISTHKLISR